jgi:hypothetical protein
VNKHRLAKKTVVCAIFGQYMVGVAPGREVMHGRVIRQTTLQLCATKAIFFSFGSQSARGPFYMINISSLLEKTYLGGHASPSLWPQASDVLWMPPRIPSKLTCLGFLILE